jgi:hypothetical protein
MKQFESIMSKEERKSIQSELIQILVSYSVMAFIAMIVICTIGAIIVKSDIDFIVNNRDYILAAFFSAVFFLLIFSIWKSIRNEISDLVSGKKHVFIGKLTDKKTTDFTGFHNNHIVDKSMRPIYTEFKFILGDKELSVEEIHFDQFNIGDEIELSQGIYTHKLFNIKKAIV